MTRKGRGRRISTARFGTLRRGRPSKAKGRSAYRGCPLKFTPECFSFPPLPTDTGALRLTAEQMKLYGLTPGQRLLWCSECENVFYIGSYSFAHIIGKCATPGGEFIPGDPKNSRYIG